jgi:hypothetical protein
VVVLHAQHIVGAPLTDLACDGALGAHRINGDDAAGQVQGAQELGNRSDFIRFLVGGNLSEHQAHLCGKGADHVQRCGGRLARGAPARFAIDGNHLFLLQRRYDARHPLSKRPLEALRIQYSKDTLKGIGRGDAIVEAQKATQPRQLDAAPLADVLKVICTTEQCSAIRSAGGAFAGRCASPQALRKPRPCPSACPFPSSA